ncbi:MAG: glycoside hydrolase family protein, partial [Balneolales bacterium]|nr:glycoside hydrolase family protein [Balneolales bacterium]
MRVKLTGFFVLLAMLVTGITATAQQTTAQQTLSQQTTGLPQQTFDTSTWANDIYPRLGTAPVDGGFAQDDYWVWGSSVIKGDDGKYHMYVSRWPKFLPFHPGWMVASEIVHAISDTPEGPYEFVDVALPARGPEYWDGRSTHNPRVLKHGDTYVLIYMGSTNPFDDVVNPDTLTLASAFTTVGRANKRIGIATSQSPYGPWERRDRPILDTKPGTFYS